MPGYLIKTTTFRVGGRDFHMQSLLDAEQFHDPAGEAASLGITESTWALFGQVWPAGEVLAQMVARRDLTGLRVLEVGAGLGLASLVGHQRGGDMTASDIHPLIPTFLAENLRLNDLPPMRYETSDWAGADSFGQFDLIIGSDLLYDDDNQEDLADFIDRHSARSVEVLLVDPNRQDTQPFHDEMAELGYDIVISQADCLLANGERFRGSYLHYSRDAAPA